jgi:drug/metabolite transporter (DMT)-like permease
VELREGASQAKVWAALAVVYVVWGSTYLGILLAIDTIPVFLSMGIRFVLAGGLLYVWAVRRGDVTGDRVGRRQWAAAVLVGGLLFVGGNSLVAWSETRVDTGVAALLIAAVPLWDLAASRCSPGLPARAGSTLLVLRRYSSRARPGPGARSSPGAPPSRDDRSYRPGCKCLPEGCCSWSLQARPES